MTTTQEERTARAAAPYAASKLEYEISSHTLKRLLENAPNRVFVVDLRSPEAYAAGHVPMARNIPLELLGESYSELPKDILIVTYCGDAACGFALLATLELAGTGFRAKRLIGGLERWSRKHFPVEATPPSPAPEY